MERAAHFQNHWFNSFIHISHSHQSRSNPTKQEENTHSPSTEPHADGRLTHNRSAVWFSKGIIYNTAITTPVPCSLQHDTCHLGLGRS
jgi:hypothetical protein